MPSKFRSIFLGIIAAAICGVSAYAAPGQWRIVPDASTIVITFDVDGEPRTGGFGIFRGEATFDPDAMSNAALRFEIETASIDLAEPFATDFVKSIDWLFVEEHPLAIYELQSLTRIEGDRFRADGVLTMRGRTNPVSGELVLTLADQSASAVGNAGFDRKEFNVGVGFSTLFVEIGPNIGVSFNLKASKVE